MKVTWVGLKLVENNERLKAEADVEFDGEFVVHYVKIVQTQDKHLVCMPAHKVKYPCTACKRKNEADFLYCGYCGEKLDPSSYSGKRLHGDACHPLVPGLRYEINQAVLAEYFKMIEQQGKEVADAS